MRIRILLLLLISLTISILLIGSNKNDSIDDDNLIVIGGREFTEQYILVEMISLLIEEYTDLKVEKKSAVSSDQIHQGLIDKEIDLYPEYTSIAWIDILNQPPIAFSDILYKEVKKEYMDEYNLKWLDLYGFNNSYGLAMNRDVADEMGIESYSDLSLKGSNLVLGGDENFFLREDAYPGLNIKYSFNFNDIRVLDIDKKYDALVSNEVDIIDIFTTDGLQEEYDIKILTDDLSYFSPYDAGSVIRMDTLEKHPELEEVLNKLGGQISDEEMRHMNFLVEKGNMEPSEVARLFLKSKGLIS